MAMPEVPTRYNGVARESAAFRLMKQMVFSLFFLLMYPLVNTKEIRLHVEQL
jgi:hypothetical protein